MQTKQIDLSRYGGFYTLGWFLRHEKSDFLKRMKRNAPITATAGSLTAWANTFDVLQETVAQLPECYHDLHIVFEYSLPKYRPKKDGAFSDIAVFADAVIVSRDTVAVLEFKQMSDPYIGHVRQTRKYRRRFQAYHESSRGMNKRALLVLTKGQNISQNFYHVHCCSADNLAQSIVEALGDSPRRHADIKSWCNSPFTVVPKS